MDERSGHDTGNIAGFGAKNNQYGVDHNTSEEQIRHTLAELAAQMPFAKNSAVSPPSAILPRREGGFLPGAFTMRADFDDPLPDSFWLGKKDATETKGGLAI